MPYQKLCVAPDHPTWAFWHLPAAAALLALAACGGGGGDTPATAQAAPAAPAASTATAPVAPPAVVFSGVAATGAALDGASLKVFAVAGNEVCATTTDAQGVYNCTLSSGATGPFIVVARKGDQALFSTAATASSGTVNVTPLTTLIVSRLSPSGDPEKIVEEVKANPSVVTAAKLATKVAEVQALIAPLTAAVGNTIDPIKGLFAANGSGHDKVLDSLQVTIRPDGAQSNVQVTIKVTPATDSTPPLSIAFKSNEATPPAPAVKIKESDLIEDGIATRVQGFLDRMTACYAHPLDKRIHGVAAGTANANGTAASIQAEVCKGLFVDDNPAKYMENGRPVASNANFSGMFKDSSTGAAFDKGNFEYRLANGDVFMTFRSTTKAGSVGHSALMLRQQGGQLKAIGNQFEHEAFIRPYATERDYPLQPHFNYVATGYSMAVSNRTDPSTGAMLFSEAAVTTPAGKRLLLKPVAGRSFMVIVQPDGTLSGTGVQYFAAGYKDKATAGNPADRDSGLVFASPQRSEDELRAIPDQGVWTVEWTHVDRSKPNVKQSYRSIARAPTLGEARAVKLPQFSAGLTDSWLARADIKAFAGLGFGAASASTPSLVSIASPGGGDGWVVGDGALFPFSVSAFGRAVDGSRFNDSLNVLSTDRSGRIGCASLSNADSHCDNSTHVSQLAAGAKVWTLELYSRTLRQLELVKSVSFYKLGD